MKNLLHPADREALITRLQNLTPEHPRQWGTLTVHQILPHLADPIRATLGEKTASDASTPMMRGFMGRLILRRLPWPRGAATAPDFLPGTGMTEPKNFNEDRQSLLLLIHRLANTAENAQLVPHPVFGPISRKDVGRLYWRHIDHHLRQFGV